MRNLMILAGIATFSLLFAGLTANTTNYQENALAAPSFSFGIQTPNGVIRYQHDHRRDHYTPHSRHYQPRYQPYRPQYNPYRPQHNRYMPQYRHTPRHYTPRYQPYTPYRPYVSPYNRYRNSNRPR